MQKKSFYWMMAAILICGMWWRFSTAASSAPVPAAAVAGLVWQVPVIYDNAKIWRFFRWNKNFAVFRLSLLRQLRCFATNLRHSKESRRKSSPINYSRASNILQYDRYLGTCHTNNWAKNQTIFPFLSFCTKNPSYKRRGCGFVLVFTLQLQL